MKKAIIFLSLAIAAATSYAKDIKEIVFTTVPEMECTSCENKIKGNLRFEKGIKDIETDITTQEIKITYDADNTSPEAFVKALAKIGYEAKEKECSDEATRTGCQKGKSGCCKGNGSESVCK